VNCKPEFKDAVAEIYLKEQIDTYIPYIDEEIFVAALLYEQGKFRKDLSLQVRSSSIADLCNDKYKTFLWLSELNILTPECFTIDSRPSNNGIIF